MGSGPLRMTDILTWRCRNPGSERAEKREENRPAIEIKLLIATFDGPVVPLRDGGVVPTPMEI